MNNTWMKISQTIFRDRYKAHIAEEVDQLCWEFKRYPELIARERLRLECLLWYLRDSLTTDTKENLAEVYRAWAYAPYIKHHDRYNRDRCPGYELHALKYGSGITNIMAVDKHYYDFADIAGTNEAQLRKDIETVCCICGSPVRQHSDYFLDDTCRCGCHRRNGREFFKNGVLQYINECLEGNYGDYLSLFSFMKVRLIDSDGQIVYKYAIDCLNDTIVYERPPTGNELAYAGIRTPFRDFISGEDIYEYDSCISVTETEGRIETTGRMPVNLIPSVGDNGIIPGWKYNDGIELPEPMNIFLISSCNTIERISRCCYYPMDIPFDHEAWIKSMHPQTLYEVIIKSRSRHLK